MADTTPKDPNLFIAFFVDLFNRWKLPTPKTMKILSDVAYALSGITLIPVLFPALVGTAAWLVTTFIVSIFVGTVARLAVKNTALSAAKLPFTVAMDGVPLSTTLTKSIAA